MRSIPRLGLFGLVCVGGISPLAWAQFSVEGYPIQVHGFFSEGYLLSNGNNFLTAPTARGTFALTDGGLNVSSQITNKLRVGAQAYIRNIGELGNGHVTLDWAFVDYRFHDRLGVRAGQVKTVLGLYNDTQDMEFLHTWALQPQSLYPLDLRGQNISHLGGDLYGTVPVKHFGDLSYTAYAGRIPPDRGSGQQYGLESYGYFVSPVSGSLEGADLKWASRIRGLVLGTSYLASDPHLDGANLRFGGPFGASGRSHDLVFSTQYSHGPWRIDWERSRITSLSTVTNPLGAYGRPSYIIPFDTRGWYTSFTYRFSKYFEAGTYHSRFYPNADRQELLQVYLPAAARHVYDQALTARFDMYSHWDLKIEGHFMDGYGEPATARGFYPQDNPQGLKPKTNLLVVRLGFNL